MSTFSAPVSNTPVANSRHGFALVIALSLMSFILLLVLSLSTLLQVENSVASTSLKQLEARLNAQLGAMIALGDLQRYTGPDQRVTARSDILLAPGERGPAGQERWTGVWSSKSNTSDALDTVDGLNNRQPVWLVSGENPDAKAAIGTNTVALATVGKSVIDKSSNGTDETVLVESEPILGSEDNESGRFAYWVSDEGIKARVNLADPHLDSSDPDAEYYRNAMAQVADPTAVSNYEGVQRLTATNSRWKNANLDPAGISSLKNIPIFLEEDLKKDPNFDDDLDGVSREFFHDFTVHSSGVLANVKDGGLKRDLSTALLSLPTDLQGPMFPPAGSSAGEGDPGGPKWEQLGDYFSQCRSGSGSSIAFRMPTPDQAGIAPVVTRFNFIIQVFAERLTTASVAPGYIDKATDYNYFIGVFPLITLWNPYDRDLTIPELGLQTDLRGIVLRDAPEDGSLLALLMPTDTMPYIADQRRRMMGLTISAGTIPAGMAINYTPPINSYLSQNDASENVLKQGASDRLVRGFFFGPVNLQDSVKYPRASGNNFYINNGFSDVPIPFGSAFDSKPSVSNQIVEGKPIDGGLWTQIVNLYANPNLNKEERFLTISTNGPGRMYVNNLWKTPRVVRFSEIGVSSGDILQVGASRTENYNDFSVFSIEEINNKSKSLAGITLIKNFPKSTKAPRDQPVNLLTQFNPRTLKSFTQIHMKEATESASSSSNPNMGYRQYSRGLRRWWEGNMYENLLDGTDDIYAKVGLGNNSEGSDKMILFEAPSYPPLGIGQLMHANLTNVYEVSHSFDEANSSNFGWDNNYQQIHTTPAYAIGNSIVNIHLPLHETRVEITKDSEMFESEIDWWNNKIKGAHYDYSYELNDALWDNFLFTGMDPAESVSEQDEEIDFPLPNSRIVLWDEAAQVVELLNERRAAAYLLLEGAFNVNSTSVAAWEAVLGAMREIATLGESFSDNQLHNYARFLKPIKKSLSSPYPDKVDGVSQITYAADRDAIAASYRALTDEEIAALSRKIVEEIRTRSAVRSYPFLSLSNFVNRSIAPDDINISARKRFAFVGALQSAIDQSKINGKPALNATGEAQAGSNGLWEDGYLYRPHKNTVYPYLEDSVEAIEERPLMEGAPGFLMQADVLSKIGSQLNGRSDTFTIRSYGSSTSMLSGTTETEGYFELVVQRTPEYVDSSEARYQAPPIIESNQNFGRRYKIVSHRWIEKNGI